MSHVQTYEKRLKQVFTDDDPDLAARVARVCVLFEDFARRVLGLAGG